MREFTCPLSSSSTLEIILNTVGDIQNENIVRKILKGAFTMGYLSKCFVLNTWMYHHIRNRFDPCTKGISPAHPFSLLYSLCICICFHVFFVFLCANINSQINALSKVNMEDMFLFQSCITVQVLLFLVLCQLLSLCQSRGQWVTSTVVFSFADQGWCPCMMTPKLRALCSSACENSQRQAWCPFS